MSNPNVVVVAVGSLNGFEKGREFNVKIEGLSEGFWVFCVVGGF